MPGEQKEWHVEVTGGRSQVRESETERIIVVEPGGGTAAEQEGFARQIAYEHNRLAVVESALANLAAVDPAYDEMLMWTCCAEYYRKGPHQPTDCYCPGAMVSSPCGDNANLLARSTSQGKQSSAANPIGLCRVGYILL